MSTLPEVMPDGSIPVLDHGFVRLDDAMADDLSVVNSARVSFGRRKTEMDESDAGLIRFLMRDRHGTPYEHNSFRFHVRCPIFVAREWFRHRIGCLGAETVVTFVNCHGRTAPHLRKTMEELWRMWHVGERDGHALPIAQREEVDRLALAGQSLRSISRSTKIGRRAVTSHLRGRTEFRSARSRVRGMKLRVLNEATQEFEVGHISDVVDKGTQPVYRLTLSDGKTLVLTENHRVLTTEGWFTMRDAIGLVGHGPEARMSRPCSLLTNGTPAHRNREWLEAQRRQGRSVGEMAAEAGCSYHTIRKWLGKYDLTFEPGEATRGKIPWNRGLRYQTGRELTSEHKAAIRRARTGEASNFWRGGITSQRASIGRWTREQAPRVHRRYDYTCQECDRRGGVLHAHHIIPVWRDPALAREFRNLITLCGDCHRRVHRTPQSELDFARRLGHRVTEEMVLVDPPLRGWKMTARASKVVDVEFVGVQRTFDLCVEGPWHNFVANGIVVHNSFNEFSMRYARATDEFYVPEADDVRSQVGKPGSYSFEPVEPELAETTREEMQVVYETAYATYERLVEQGVARELARAVLPVAAYTEFYWTVNARALMNFVSLRNAETAQREIQRYAAAVEHFLAEKMPITYDAFVAGGRVAP